MPVIYFKPLISAPSLHYHFAIAVAATDVKCTKCGHSFHKIIRKLYYPFFKKLPSIYLESFKNRVH